jgi:hypothetical protein
VDNLLLYKGIIWRQSALTYSGRKFDVRSYLFIASCKPW